MEKRILVAYASEFGSTASVAQMVGEVLREAGALVDVRAVVDVSDLGSYQSVIVGSAVYNGTWLPEAVYFVEHYAETLSRLPVAYFVVCATMVDDTVERRQGARSFLAQVLQQVPQVQPVAIGLFAGNIDVHKLPWPVRFWMRLTADLHPGDYRDWGAIRSWATRIQPLLMAIPRYQLQV